MKSKCNNICLIVFANATMFVFEYIHKLNRHVKRQRTWHIDSCFFVVLVVVFFHVFRIIYVHCFTHHNQVPLYFIIYTPIFFFLVIVGTCTIANRRTKCRRRWRDVVRYSRYKVDNIEIINNTRGGIESEIGERGYWGANLEPGCYFPSKHIASRLETAPAMGQRLNFKSKFKKTMWLFKL